MNPQQIKTILESIKTTSGDKPFFEALKLLMAGHKVAEQKPEQKPEEAEQKAEQEAEQAEGLAEAPPLPGQPARTRVWTEEQKAKAKATREANKKKAEAAPEAGSGEASGAASVAGSESSESKKKAGRPKMTEEQKAAAKVKREAAKAAKAEAVAEVAEVPAAKAEVKPLMTGAAPSLYSAALGMAGLTGVATALNPLGKSKVAKKPLLIAPKKVDLSFFPWKHGETSYYTNDRGDVVSEEFEWVGRYSGEVIDTSAPEPEDLAAAVMRE